MIRKAWILLAAGALAGCSPAKRIPAVGPGSEIVVLSSERSRSLRERVVSLLSREVRLVQFEPTFDTVSDALGELSFYSTRKLLLVVGTPGDEEFEKFLHRPLGERNRTSFPGLWSVFEPFSAGQVLFILSGKPGILRETLESRADEFLGVVDEVAVTLLLTNLFRAGEQPGAREAMLRRWGWGVRLPPEWMIDDRFASENFVRLWKDGPVMQLFVSWEEGRAQRTPRGWLARRGELVRRFYAGDANVAERCEARPGRTPFGRRGMVLSGLWENPRYVIGGPFRAWAFYCPQDGRTYLVDLSVYAPDRSKLPLLRVLKAVSRTFRCPCVPAASPRGRPL